MTERMRLIVFGLMCVVFNFTNAECTVTAPSDGLVDGKTSVTVQDDTNVTFSCNKRFTLNGDVEVLCRAGELRGSIPTCEGFIAECTAKNPTNGAVDVTNPASGATVTYSCDIGYTLDGATTLTCRGTTLTGPEPTCEADCAVTAPSNGLVDGETSVTVPDKTYVTFTCNKKFTLNGEAKVVCSNGELELGEGETLPTCADGQSTHCTANNTTNGAVDVTNPASGTTVTYSCDTGYTLDGPTTLTCRAQLTGPEPTCKPVSGAPLFDATAPVNVSVKENTAVGTNVNAAITASGDAVLTYTLTSQIPDSSPKIFSVDTSSGLLTVAKSPDYESNKQYTLNITVTSSQGTANDTTDDTSAHHTITVYILDVEEDSSASETASSLTITLLLLTVVLVL